MATPLTGHIFLVRGGGLTVVNGVFMCRCNCYGLSKVILKLLTKICDNIHRTEANLGKYSSCLPKISRNLCQKVSLKGQIKTIKISTSLSDFKKFRNQVPVKVALPDCSSF